MKKTLDIIFCIIVVINTVFSAIMIANNVADAWDWIIIVDSGVLFSFWLYQRMKR